jgi:hypothetical protein
VAAQEIEKAFGVGRALRHYGRVEGGQDGKEMAAFV